MNRNKSRQYIDRITDAAVEWHVRLQDASCTSTDKREFACWLRASEAHVREYLRAATLFAHLHELGPDPDIAQIVAAAQAEQNENVVELFDLLPAELRQDHEHAKGRARRRRTGGLAVAAIVVAALAVTWLWLTAGPVIYQTATGEQISFPLPDGSVVMLNTRSRVELQYSATRRDIVLVSGEALFDVSKDPLRPFRVMAKGVVIEALGTRFNVRSRRGGTMVTVVEGAVAVKPAAAKREPASGTPEPGDQQAGDGVGFVATSPVKVGIGQQARIDIESGTVAVDNVDAGKAMIWRERRLVFQSQTLAEVINEFNLYNSQAMVIADSDLEQITISGAFQANDRASFILFLEEMNLATARTDRDGRVSIMRKQAKNIRHRPIGSGQ